jgi:hypothetical protein
MDQGAHRKLQMIPSAPEQVHRCAAMLRNGRGLDGLDRAHFPCVTRRRKWNH